ncbi:MAG: PEP-CTERM sorting domain-containing protein [Akkermansiaceae bacterium]|jgi:hypothetical protein|nr:PEP-CTERM sorting domain-containing protein [Akkermansiaceae bacterium]MDP4779460.1 PEP-CTERM sorting domain-containing protein [Akkermansiaceae bacterium]MDP4897137.1 PEP-CTERM sorting domain-containing protein [Akkermansiaceae bacterium]
MKKTLPLFGAAFLGTAITSSAAILLTSEDFGSLVDQAPLVASDGNASVSFGANAIIGDANAAGDAASGGIYSSAGAPSGLSTRNGIRGYTTVANVNFTTASGSVGQLHTHTAGGFGVLSTGPITTVGGAATQPTPLVLTTPAEGDIIRVTFDMYVQAVRTTGTDNLVVNWNLKDASFNVIAFADTWDDYKNASVGDLITVQKDLTITSDMISAGLDSVGPQFTFLNAPGQITINTAFAQIDNFKVEQIAVPEPSSMALLGLGALGLMVRRRR